MRLHLRLDRIVLFDVVLFEVADDGDGEAGPEVLDLVAEHDTPEPFGFSPGDDDDEEVPDEC